MDIEAVAQRLAVSVRHVRRLVTEKRIPYRKWGHLLRFEPDEIEEWIAASRVPVDSRFLARAETDMERREWRDPRLGRVTFGGWAADYMEGARHKRATTKALDDVVLRKHLLPVLAARPLVSITPLDVRRIVDAMAERLAPATVRTNYGVMKAVMNAAVEADLLVRSPCRGVRLPGGEKRARLTLGPDDLARLAAGMRPEYRPIVYVAGLLGLRWSEIAGLRVRHLDFLRRTLTVSETIAEVNGKLLPASTKSEAGRRTLAVPPFLMAMLAEHLAAGGRPGPDELVFTAPAGGPLRPANFQLRVWGPAVQAAGLDGLTFHGLRHVAASFMVGSGEHPRVIQHRLGHSTARLSLELYAHVSEDADRSAAAHLESLFLSGADREPRASSES